MKHIIVTLALAALVVACKAPPFPKNEKHGPPVPPAPVKHVPATPPGPAAAKPVPAGKVAEITEDIGDVKRGEWATHVFTIENDRKEVLHVKQVRGG